MACCGDSMHTRGSGATQSAATRIRKQTDVARQGAAVCASWLIRCVRATVLLSMAVIAAPVFATATVNGLTIEQNLPSAQRGVAYSHTITVTGGTAPYTFSLVAPIDIPNNLTLSAGGTLSGAISCNEANGNNRQIITITDSSASPIATRSPLPAEPRRTHFRWARRRSRPSLCCPRVEL